jgi:4-hydroxy-tetrahydrodipicolinate reductase
LAHRLSQIQKPITLVSEIDLVEEKESPAANLSGIQVHSRRLPGHFISIDSIFGLKDE